MGASLEPSHSSVHDSGSRAPSTVYEKVPAPRRGHSDISDEDGPWARKTVLSFDGGGVRGYSSLLIVKQIMIKIRELETQHPENPVFTSNSYPWMGDEWGTPKRQDDRSDRVDNFLPCHYFDYMVGTSTGGLSSIMLGRLRMTVDEALDQYAEFGNAVFGKPRWFHETSPLWYPRAKFSSRKTRIAFQKVVYESIRRDRPNAPLHDAHTESFKYREDRTRTIAVSYNINTERGVSKHYIWRTYDNDPIPFDPNDPGDIDEWCVSNPGLANKEAIWEVARATTAAPKYFESIKIKGKKFLDGGMAANNPSLLALQEIHELHNTVPAFFVSIGTGLKKVGDTTERPNRTITNRDFESEMRNAPRTDDVRRKQFLKKYLEIFRHWKDTMVDCEGQIGTLGWLYDCRAIGLDHKYRLNVDGELSKIRLDEWRPADTGKTTLDEIKAKTERYLEKRQVKAMISAIAEQAVDIRRQRAKTERWEDFALDVEYTCPLGCGGRQRYPTRAKLRTHLKRSPAHLGSDGHTVLLGDDLEAALDKGRSFRRGTLYPR